jgi:hypothetical protein
VKLSLYLPLPAGRLSVILNDISCNTKSETSMWRLAS